jgi:hypothetical protein
MKPFILLALYLILTAAKVSAQSANRYDIVIDELMIDPTPQLGLPDVEWVELKNTTDTPINVEGWQLADASGLSGRMPAFVLQPDSFLLVCAGSAVTALSAFGPVISVTRFPSLNNDEDQLILTDANGRVIHAVQYTADWYQNPVKAEGGWTLEMIDPQNPCAANNNWIASIDESGGTPGRRNSVNGILDDDTAPAAIRTFTTDSTHCVIVFNKPVDSSSAAQLHNYKLTNNLSLISATALPPFFDQVLLQTGMPMETGTVYQVTVSNITDCKGNTSGTGNTVKAGIPEIPDTSGIVVNEILFNPNPNGYDYVELYNRSNQIADAAHLFIANRSGGSISSVKALASEPFYIFPGDYIVLTENKASLAMNYLVKNPGQVLTVASLPSFPDDEGDVLLLDRQGHIIDEVAYKDDWHFQLLHNNEGVALERIDPNAPSQDAGNWHSAASTAGYGTPTYQNSQFRQAAVANATLTITPTIFSPDNDGIDDIVTIRYNLDNPGFVANITIFDAAGRPVRALVHNATLGLNGNWNWDGLDDKGLQLPAGQYIVLTELFNLQGKTQQFKNVIVLARRM